MITRWICEKCSKKWIYPVEKCLYCKGPTAKQKGTKVKVVGMTKVFIPSPMHPIIPYNILLLQDEHGNRLPKKTMKEYHLGDEYVEEKAKTKDAVAVVKIKYDIYEAIKHSIELLDISLNENDHILVKPSVIAAAYPYQAVNTNPEFLDALLRVLFDHGIKKENIIVAEQALIDSDSVDAASKAGILEVCKKHGVNFLDISKGPFEEIVSEGYKFEVFKEALHRKIINCPVMKTNSQLHISGTLENLTRLCDEATQRQMYYDNIDETLPKLAKFFANVTNIADASSGMQAQGPLAAGEPAFLNLIFAGNSASNLDAVFCEAAMIQLPFHVKNSTKNEIRNIEVVGNELEALKYPLKQAMPHETLHPDIKVLDGKACPACMSLLYGLTSKLVGLRGEELTIVMGSQINGEMLKSGRVVVLGNCAVQKLEELKINAEAVIGEEMDAVEQIVLMKKLLTTKGSTKITTVDKVKSKMTKLLSKVMK